MKTGIELIAAERAEQIEKHGRTIKRDAIENQNCQLAFAAERLCIPELDIPNYIEPMNWNEDLWDKMTSKPYKERLIIAGALIAAEIDRLNYIVLKTKPSEPTCPECGSTRVLDWPDKFQCRRCEHVWGR